MPTKLQLEQKKEIKWKFSEVKKMLIDGPWMKEPDKVQFYDNKTGYTCLILRGPIGSLCGYVGIPKTHPHHGVHYDEVPVYAHGGLTFSSMCAESANTDNAICHVPYEGEEDSVWWLGFDCAHLNDFSPSKSMSGVHRYKGESYKDIKYVKKEIKELAKQLKELED